MSSIILGIDASNIQTGGGLTHLVELLRVAKPQVFGVSQVILWGKKKTLYEVEDRDWLCKAHHPWLERSLAHRILWQRFKLKKLAETAGCDLLFVPGGSDVSSFSPLVAMNQNLLPFEYHELKRYGCSLRTLKFLSLKFTQSRTFRKANGIIFLTEYARDVVMKAIGKSTGDSAIISHGVGHHFLCSPRPQYRKAMYSEEQPCQILYVSTIDLYKHQWHVVEAVEELRAGGMHVVLDLVGFPGPGYRKLQNALKKYDETGTFIRYHGEVPYKNLNRFYELADIGVFASSCETFGQILTEMMAMGLPIACSSRSAMPEVLGHAGIYFDPENSKDIARALREYINSLDLRLKKSKAALERAQTFSWEQCANKTFEFLSNVARSQIA